MPAEVLHQIQYLCKNIPKVEWSGALFYTTEGSIEKPETFKITLKTILPLDMGSSAYTEYNLDGRFLDFIEEDFEERCTWKLGHIHSHNTMGVFFSGTDMAELNDNAPSHNFYLSLIVNNYMDFMAKVAFTAEAKQDIKSVPYLAKNSQGEDYTIETVDFEVDSTKLFIYNCEILSPKEDIIVEEDFAAQVAEIMKPKPKPVTPAPTQQFLKQVNPAMPGKSWSRTMEPNIPSYDFDFNAASWEEEQEDLLALEDILISPSYSFAKKILHNAEEDIEESIEDVLDYFRSFQITPAIIAETVLGNYVTLYEECFPDSKVEDFVQIGYEVVDFFEEVSIIYPEIRPTIKSLNMMIEKFITDGK